MKKLLEKIKKYDSEDLLKSGSVFFISSALVSILNYFYHLFMGRMLGPNDYGILGSLFAIIYLATFFTQTFNKVISKYTAEFNSRQQNSYIKRLIKQGFIKICLVGGIILIFYVSLSPLIAKFMKINNIFYIIFVGLIAYIFLINSILIGALNGLQKFIKQNISSLISVFLKFALAVFFVYLGIGIFGALGAIFIGLFAGMLSALYFLRDVFRNFKSEKFDSRKIYRYALPVFFSSLFPTLMITFDHILVKHFFSSVQTGFYSAAGMIAKIIWFGSGFFVLALFPKIVDVVSKGRKASGLLIRCLIYTFFLVAVGLSAYFIMPKLIVMILYGKQYLSIIPLIGIFGAGMGLFSLSQVLITYNLAAEKYNFIWILFVSFAVEIAGIYLFHNSLIDVVKVFFGSNLIMFIGILMINRKELGVNIAQ
ncbi:oligosaccharide flippase family protein [Candidatus Woesearchaeota archaeon]|nr:oligosaccharide flippase family protein [Candidatus Woesearchaeota archaeon]